jgi:hypothetical protein
MKDRNNRPIDPQLRHLSFLSIRALPDFDPIQKQN